MAKRYPDIGFALADINQVGSDVSQYFLVSSSPSLVYFDEETIETHGTLNPMLLFTELEIDEFAQSIRTQTRGMWFSGMDELRQHADTAEQEPVLLEQGMNYAAANLDYKEYIESQYALLVAQIFL